MRHGIMNGFQFEPLFDVAADGSGGGAAGTGAAGAAGAGGTGTADHAGAAGAAGATNPDGTARTGAATTGQFTYQEDRSRWIPPHRLSEESTARQTLQTRAQQLEAQLAERDEKIAALAGITKADPASAKSEEIKRAFFALPGMSVIEKLANLSEEQLDALLQVPQHIESTTRAENERWNRHADTQIGYISESVAEAMGAESLDEEQQSDLRAGLSRFIKARAKAEVETTGKSATVEAWEKGDKKLLDEFVTAYTKRWVDPARRTAAASNSRRFRPVVDSARRGAPVTSVQRPEKFKSMDERIDFGLNMLKERGVQFGR